MPYRLLTALFMILALSCGGPLTNSETQDDSTRATSGNDNPTATTDGEGLNGATEVGGEVVTVDGVPIAGATIYIPGVTATAGSASATRTYSDGLTASDGTTCEDAPEEDQPLIAVCTAADGSFTIDTSALSGNPTQIVIQKGSLRIIVPLTCTESVCTISGSLTTLGSGDTVVMWPNVAVVTGDLDRMEDVIAKMADDDTTDDTNGYYGRINSETGRFVYGSEYDSSLTIINGNAATTSEENGVSYVSWDKYLTGIYPLVVDDEPVFDIILINCGNAYESLIIDNEAVLQDYVDAGGRLFVTDLSYDFIEQPFPYVMKFENDSDLATTPGTLNAAQNGVGGNQYSVTINSETMITWLASASVNQHDATTPGNPEIDCDSNTTSYEQYPSALESSGLLPLGGLLNHWAHMTNAHSGYDPMIWISSGDEPIDDLDDRPLTISMDLGTNGGRIVYSSYHTANDCPSTGFWPQERVLQYMILNSF